VKICCQLCEGSVSQFERAARRGRAKRRPRSTHPIYLDPPSLPPMFSGRAKQWRQQRAKNDQQQRANESIILPTPLPIRPADPITWPLISIGGIGRGWQFVWANANHQLNRSCASSSCSLQSEGRETPQVKRHWSSWAS